MDILQNQLGWQYYGGKHYESIYTRFFQGYILPVKFGYDKRKGHLSSLICSGEISREQALDDLKKPTYAPTLQEEDLEYVVKKLGLTADEFEAIMRLPKKAIYDYPSYARDDRNPLRISASQLYSIPRILKKHAKKIASRLLRIDSSRSGV